MSADLMGWRRNRKKQRRGGAQPDLVGRRRKKRYRDPQRVADAKQAEQDRPGPLMAERQARIAAQVSQQPPGCDNPAPGAQTVDSRNGATGSAVATPQHGGSGGNPEGRTALFERQQEMRSDSIMVKQAKRHRWEVPKVLAEAVLTKCGMMAAQGDPNDTKPNHVKLSPVQMLAAGKLMLDIERQNQAEEHHADRMDFYERQLQVRAKVGDYVPGAQVHVNTGGGAAAVSIFLPATDEIQDENVLNPPDEQEG